MDQKLKFNIIKQDFQDLNSSKVCESLGGIILWRSSSLDPLPELLKSKKVAYLSNNTDKLVAAVKHIDQFDRMECMKYAEKYFDSLIMAENYMKVYRKLVQ